MIEVLTISNPLPPFKVAMCSTPDEVTRFFLDEAFAICDVPKCSDAAGQTFTCNHHGQFFCVMRIDTKGGAHQDEILGLIVHESTHVATDYFDYLGVGYVDDEVRAYVQQSIAQTLIEQYLKHTTENKEN